MAISEKIVANALALKTLIQRSMSQADIEEATRACNGLLAEAERVAGLESRLLVHMEPGGAEKAAGHA